MTRRVAITGLGFVTPLGTDVQSTWEGLVAGRSGAGPITRFDPAQSPVKFACEVKGFEPTRFLDKKEVRRFDLFAQFAVGAAEQAVTDACLANNWDKVDLKRVGVIVGTGTGGLQTFEENARALFEKGPSRVSPFFVPMYMPNVAAALISGKKVTHPYMGISLTDAAGGAGVANVKSGSPADRAGLQSGDVVTSSIPTPSTRSPDDVSYQCPSTWIAAQMASTGAPRSAARCRPGYWIRCLVANRCA